VRTFDDQLEGEEALKRAIRSLNEKMEAAHTESAKKSGDYGCGRLLSHPATTIGFTPLDLRPFDALSF
jgi:hypothetical protein